MPAANYKIYSGHGDTGLPDSTAGTHPGYMAKVRTLASTGGYQYNLAQASSAVRSLDYIDSSYLGTPLAPASRSPGQLRAPGGQGDSGASLESKTGRCTCHPRSAVANRIRIRIDAGMTRAPEPRQPLAYWRCFRRRRRRRRRMKSHTDRRASQERKGRRKKYRDRRRPV